MSSLSVELLSALHQRKDFDCGVDPLNNFIRDYALQNQKKHINRTFVAVSSEKTASARKFILGYYTLVSGHVSSHALPHEYSHPRYPVAIARIARLAVATEYQGQGIGKLLLHDALQKILRAAETIGIYAVVVNAKDKTAKKFYQQYGFIPLQDSALTLVISLASIQSAINSA